MKSKVEALAVDAFTLAKTVEPLPGVVAQFTCRAPSGASGNIPAIWLPVAAIRQLHADLATILRSLDSDPRTKTTPGH